MVTTAEKKKERKTETQKIADKVRYRTMMGQRTGRVEEQEKLGR